jgi:hypothetical protein
MTAMEGPAYLRPLLVRRVSMQFPSPSSPVAWQPLPLSGSVVIATSEPVAFERAFEAWAGGRILVTDNADDVMQALGRRPCDRLLLDSAPLADGWTGPRIAQRVFSQPGHADVQVWLMTPHAQGSEGGWALPRGVAGTLPRDPCVLASMVFGDKPSADRLDDRLRDIEEAFRSFAGPLAGDHIESARSEVMPLGAQYLRAAYVRALMERLPLPQGRAAFRAAVDAPRRESPGARGK